MIKQALKSKTVWYSIAVDALAVLQIIAEELRAAIPAEFYGYFIIAVGIGIKYFRVITKESLDAK